MSSAWQEVTLYRERQLKSRPDWGAMSNARSSTPEANLFQEFDFNDLEMGDIPGWRQALHICRRMLTRVRAPWCLLRPQGKIGMEQVMLVLVRNEIGMEN